ncbi:MAG: hypothetical protein IMW91_02815 [Firmicutes bacterium]|nr:hypothetical protein [Bacillota bacterium]
MDHNGTNDETSAAQEAVQAAPEDQRSLRTAFGWAGIVGGILIACWVAAFLLFTSRM